MKLKLFAVAAAVMLTTGTAYATADMKDCCKGESCCCDKMKDEKADRNDQGEQHKH